MTDPIALTLIAGIGTNLATSVVQTKGSSIRDTWIGRRLAALGILRPGLTQRLQQALAASVEEYLTANPHYAIPEIERFLRSSVLTRQLRGYIIEGKSVDVRELAERLAMYVDVPVGDRESWPNRIDPFSFVLGLVECIRRHLAEDADEGIIWISQMLAEHGPLLQRIDDKVTQLHNDIRNLSRKDEDNAIRTEFESAFLSHLRTSFERVTTPGARELHGIGQALSVAYISLNIKADDSGDPIRAEQFLAQNRLVVVRGPAGSGKTTLLSWIVTQCADDDSEDNPWSGLVPFFIPLRRVTRLHHGAPSIDKLVDYSVDDKVWSVPSPEGWIHRILRVERRGVIMIDGVDEFPATRRPDFWKWVQAVSEEYPGNRILITSRTLPGTLSSGELDEQWQPPRNFVEAQLEEMSDADIAQFIYHWHDSVVADKLTEQERVSLRDARNTLPVKLQDAASRRIRELCSTPLLCALVCVLHWREEGYLPRYRVDLYDKCCDMLIEARDLKRGVLPPVGPLAAMSKNDKEMVLQRLAIEMMYNKPDSEANEESYRIEISREKAVEWIRPNVQSFQSQGAREAGAEEVLNYLIERTGLLREPGVDLIDFPHRTFQEYLAACAAGAENQEEMLAKQADDDQWHETIMLAAGTPTGGVGFGRKLIDALVRRGERHKGVRERSQRIRKTSFALALGCLENLRQQDPILRQRVLSNLGELVPPRNEADARILSVAGDAAVQHLNYDRWKDESPSTVAACARSLRLIGTSEAIQALEDGYIQDGRGEVIAEVCRAGHFPYREIPAIVEEVERKGKLPHFAASEVIGLYADLPGLKEISLDVPEVKDLHVLSSLRELLSLSLARTPNSSVLLCVPKQIKALSIEHGFLSDLNWLDRLKGLEILSLIAVGGLESIAEIKHASGLRTVNLFLMGVDTLQPLADLKSLRAIAMTGLGRVSDLSPLQGLPELSRIHIEQCGRLQNIEDLSQVRGLESLRLEELRVYPPQECWTNSRLTEIALLSVQGLNDVEFLRSIDTMKSISLVNCKNLRSISGIEHMRELETLEIADCPVREMPKMEYFTELRNLKISGIAALSDRHVRGVSSKMETVFLERCGLTSLEFLGGSTNIKKLILRSIPKVELLGFLHDLPELRFLQVSDLESLGSLDSLSGSNVESLSLNGMYDIDSLAPLAANAALKSIEISDCPAITDLSPLIELPALQRIILSGRMKADVPEELKQRTRQFRSWFDRFSPPYSDHSLPFLSGNDSYFRGGHYYSSHLHRI